MFEPQDEGNLGSSPGDTAEFRAQNAEKEVADPKVEQLKFLAQQFYEQTDAVLKTVNLDSLTAQDVHDLAAFGERFSDFKTYFQSSALELLGKFNDTFVPLNGLMKADRDENTKKKVAAAQRAFGDRADAMGGYPTDFDVDTTNVELKKYFVLADVYFHDLAGMFGNMLMFDYMVEDDKPIDAELLGQLQNSLSDVIDLHKSFDLKEGKISEVPVSLNKLMSRIKKNVNELIEIGHIQEGRGRVPLEIEFESDFETIDPLELNNFETKLNVPLFLRLFVDVTNNIKAVYSAQELEEHAKVALMDEETREQYLALAAEKVQTNPLKIYVALRDDQLYVVFDDKGRGFPIKGEAATEPKASHVDGKWCTKYVPELGKTEWGNGTGLSGLQADFEALGGELMTGNRVIEKSDKTLAVKGARVEARMPITRKPSKNSAENNPAA